ncbi:MAG: hypothetical protein P4L33_02450 [Capsulimonadaceae bacterium]|nr:hypothetical protein [Capsulimonadaceae bacterium]
MLTIFVFHGSQVSRFTIVLAIAYSTALIGSQYFFMKALMTGISSVCTFIYSCGFIIPTVFSVATYGEPVSGFRIGGTVLIVVSSMFFCLNSKNERHSRRVQENWISPALAAMVCSGFLGILQKVDQKSDFRQEATILVAVSFVIATLASGLLTKRHLSNQKPFVPFAWSKGALAGSALIGICMGGANFLNTFLSRSVDGIILFPVVNGGTIIGAALLGRIFLNEILNGQQMVGLGAGVLGIAMFSM